MEEKVLEILKEKNALLEGHFLLSSGKHSNSYVQCARLLMYPKKAEEICKIIKEKLLKDNIKIDYVVGPAMGAILVSYEMARVLDVPSMFTERENDKMTLRRGFSIEKGKKVLVVEDVVTTGKSSNETIEVLKNLGAEVVAIASIVDRRPKGIELSYPLYSAIKLTVDAYEKEDCPLCKENKIELVKPGSRKKF